jgi:hypothetical protein
MKPTSTRSLILAPERPANGLPRDTGAVAPIDLDRTLQAARHKRPAHVRCPVVHSTTTTQSTTAIPAVVAQGTPTVATTTADTSAHASHTVAATPTAANSTAQVAGTSTETTAHADHTTTTPAPTAATNQSTEHSGHTIPAAGGNPLWLMSGALALGYIGKLLLLKRKMRAQPVILYWQ